MTDEFCKCGHAKHDHKKSFGKQCNFCPCSSYFDSKRPTKAENILSFIMIGSFVIGLIVFILVIGILYQMIDVEEPIELSVGEFAIMMIAVMVLMCYLFGTWIFDTVWEYISNKRRRDYNAQK